MRHPTRWLPRPHGPALERRCCFGDGREIPLLLGRRNALDFVGIEQANGTSIAAILKFVEPSKIVDSAETFRTVNRVACHNGDGPPTRGAIDASDWSNLGYAVRTL